MAIDFTYVDVNPFFGYNTLPALVRHDEAINSSLGNILGISRGERWYYPNFGSDLRRYLWSPLDMVTANAIYQEVVLAIGNYEPRITLTSQTGVVVNQAQQRFEVNVFYIIKTNNQHGMFTAYIKQGGSTNNDLITGPPANPSPMVSAGTFLEDGAGNVILDDQGNLVRANV